MTNEQAVNELKNYHREDGTVPEEITLAIQALETGEIYITGEDYNLYMEGYKAGKKDFEPKQGEWIAREDMDFLDENKVVHNHFECNKCGLIHDFIDGHTSQYNFCPNCGAKMKGNAK